MQSNQRRLIRKWEKQIYTQSYMQKKIQTNIKTAIPHTQALSQAMIYFTILIVTCLKEKSS